MRLLKWARWIRRVGYAVLPIAIFIGAAASSGEPPGAGLPLLVAGAAIGALVVAITEAVGWMLEKQADRTIGK